MKMISKIRWSKTTVVLMVSVAVVVALGVAMAFAVAPAPPAITATGVTTATAGGAVTVGWSAVTGAAHYVVQSKLASETTSTYITAATPTEPTCTVTGLNNGVLYEFRVAAVNSLSEESSWSVSATATPTDTHAPTTSLVTSPTTGNGANGWFTSYPTYHVSANETVTSSFETATAGSTPLASTFTTITGTVSHGDLGYLLTQGTNHLWFYSVDPANNTESVGASATVKIDVTTPTINVALDAASPDGQDGWYKTAPTATIAPTDTVSGVHTVAYAFNGVTQSTVTTDTTVTIPSSAIPSGVTTITSWAIDTAGNQSATDTKVVKFDAVAPSVPSTPTGHPAAAGAIRVTWPASTDPTSGVSTYTVEWSAESSFTAPGSATTTNTTYTTGSNADGTHLYFHVRAADAAGNLSAWSASSDATADAKAPVLTVSPNSSTWATPSITATISIEETNSGLAYVNYKVLPAGSSTPSVNTTLTAIDTTQVVVPIPEGDYTLEVRAADVAGNVATPVSKSYQTDSHAPVTVIDHTVPASADGVGGVFVTPPLVNLRATDAASGATTTIQYKWSSGSDTTSHSIAGTSSIFVQAPSVNTTLTYGAFDGAGNVETPYHIQAYLIDVHQPVPTITFSGTPNGAGWRSSTTTASITATTAGGPAIVSTVYKYDGASTWTTYTVPFAVIEGSHTVTAYSVDASGNTGPQRSASYKLDMTAPEVGEFTPMIVHSAHPTLTVSVTDTGSGVVSGEMRGAPGPIVSAVASGSTLSAKLVPPLAVGDNVIAIVAVDAAGKSTTAYRVVTYVFQYTLTYVAGANGSISGDTTQTQTVDAHEDGTAVTAVANTGYHFTGWSDGSTANPRTDTNVKANKSVTANFAINTYTLTPSRSNKHGTISPSSRQTVNYGGSKKFTIKPARNYKISKVLVDGKSIGKKTSYTFKNVTKNHTIKAYFVHK